MEGLADQIGRRLGEQVGADQDRQEVLAYGALMVLQNGATLLMLLLLSFLTGSVREALVAAAASSFLRVVAGGAHLSTPWRCASFTALIFWVAGWLTSQASPFMLGFGLWIAIPVTLVNLQVLYRMAPVEAESRPLEPEHKARLRRSSLIRGGLLASAALAGLAVGTWLGIAVLLGFCTASFTLAPAGRQFTSSFDSLCSRVLGRCN